MNKKETKSNPEKQGFPLHPLSRFMGLHSTFCSTDQSKRRERLLRAVWMSFSPFFTSVKNPFKNLRPLETKKEEEMLVSKFTYVQWVEREGGLQHLLQQYLGHGREQVKPCGCPFWVPSLSLTSTLLWPFLSDAAQQWSSKCGPRGPQLQYHLGIC